ncbi:unnamed protein product [Effrenium voratum]|uniref:Peptidase M14 domain-containing protein n=1 Tax=Effrenium voratum TaxID=2562239 RepID=A0AA36NFK1_9DINO|nr:unnamed protein product [Effrenium voratum]CAJ1400268.1 unnamed protein product [Effrenium voratum]CAJ1420991.1 unnamed protein product [Effrenium voratum]
MMACAWTRWLQVAILCHLAPADRVFRYRSYRETHDFFEDLKRRYPDIVEIWYAQDIFPEILPEKKSWGTCEGEPCKTLIVRIANKRLLTNSTPEVFFSGALHGDERVGPLTVTELAAFLCERYATNEQVRRLVDYRATWIMPMTNAHGYANRRRDENQMDPNRDFPYLQQPDRCMRTQTARAVNELFRRHLFQFMITFHGGMRALTYEWGSRNHMTKKRTRSTEPPDDTAFREVGEAIQAAAGKTLTRRWFYPLGRINDLVYPVEGGMEDWSYAAGWESSPMPITVCRPNTYGGYAEERTKYRHNSISTLVYLAEMDDYKTVPDSKLGHSEEIWSLGVSQGHVPRNLRMCLKLIELTRPEVVVLPPKLPAAVGAGSSISVEVYGFGCHEMSVRLLAVPSSLLLPGCQVEDALQEQVLVRSTKLADMKSTCQGLTLWQEKQHMVALQGSLPAGQLCLLVAAEFDARWAQQSAPDPHGPPRSHAARMRLEERYTAQASDGPMRIESRRTKLFAVHREAINAQAAMASQEPAASSHDALDNEEKVPMPAVQPAKVQIPIPTTAAPASEASSATSTAVALHLSDLKDAPTMDLVAVAAVSFLLSFLVGLALLACRRHEAHSVKANTKDAQTTAELARIVGKSPHVVEL